MLHFITLNSKAIAVFFCCVLVKSFILSGIPGDLRKYHCFRQNILNCIFNGVFFNTHTLSHKTISEKYYTDKSEIYICSKHDGHLFNLFPLSCRCFFSCFSLMLTLPFKDIL